MQPWLICPDYAFALWTPLHLFLIKPVLPFFFFYKLIQTTENCSAEVLFSRGEQQHSAQVQASCEALLKIDTKAQEEEFYKQYKMNQSLQSAQYLPGM